MRIQQFNLSQATIDLMKRKSFITTQDVTTMFKTHHEIKLNKKSPSFKVEKVYLKDESFLFIKEAGLEALNGKFCFISIFKGQTLLWKPFDDILYVIDGEPFAFNRKAANLLCSSVLLTSYELGKSSYNRENAVFLNTGEEFFVVQNNTLLREFKVLFNGIKAQHDLVKVSVEWIGFHVMQTRTCKRPPMWLSDNPAPKIPIKTSFFDPRFDCSD